MKVLLLIVLSVVFASAPSFAQQDSVSVQIGDGETCPSGWTQTDPAWTSAARYYFVLPTALVDDFRRTHAGHYSTPIEILVSLAFVHSIWPTDTQKAAAIVAGQLRAELAASGTTRTCSLS
jgi:hypothetical protein